MRPRRMVLAAPVTSGRPRRPNRARRKPLQRLNDPQTHRDAGNVLLALITRHLCRLALRRRTAINEWHAGLPLKRG